MQWCAFKVKLAGYFPPPNNNRIDERKYFFIRIWHMRAFTLDLLKLHKEIIYTNFNFAETFLGFLVVRDSCVIFSSVLYQNDVAREDVAYALKKNC